MKPLIAALLSASAALAANAQAPKPPSTPAPSAAPAVAPLPTSPAKKELVRKMLALQQPDLEAVARGLVERPASQMMQEVATVLQRQVAADKRDAIARTVQADVRKFVDDAVPLVRDRAVKLAPLTIGPIYEEKFTEDELRQLIAWFSSPLNKKFQQVGPELRNAFVQKLVTDVQPVIEPKVQALDARIRVALGIGPTTPSPSATPGPGSAAPAPPPAKAK